MHWIAMEDVGPSLFTLSNTLPLSSLLTPSFKESAMKSLSALHACKVLHQDISDCNITLRADGTVFIIDLSDASTDYREASARSEMADLKAIFAQQI